MTDDDHINLIKYKHKKIKELEKRVAALESKLVDFIEKINLKTTTQGEIIRGWLSKLEERLKTLESKYNEIIDRNTKFDEVFIKSLNTFNEYKNKLPDFKKIKYLTNYVEKYQHNFLSERIANLEKKQEIWKAPEYLTDPRYVEWIRVHLKDKEKGVAPPPQDDCKGCKLGSYIGTFFDAQMFRAVCNFCEDVAPLPDFDDVSTDFIYKNLKTVRFRPKWHRAFFTEFKDLMYTLRYKRDYSKIYFLSGIKKLDQKYKKEIKAFLGSGVKGCNPSKEDD